MSGGLLPLVGHEDARRSLARAHLNGTLPTALFLHGPEGVGKQRLGLWLGQLMLCEAPSEEGPCDRCRSCRMARGLEHPDIHWHFALPRPRGSHSPARLGEKLEEARHAELAEWRKQPLRASHAGEARAIYLAAAQTLRRAASRRPSMSALQLFLLAGAESLVPQESSPEAANALLKLLEEPPESTRFILTSSEPGGVIPTIRSRTLPLHLGRLPAQTVERFLSETLDEVDPKAIAKATRLSEGSIGRALGFLPDGEEEGPLEQRRRRAFRLIRAALDPRPSVGFAAALSFKVTGARGLLDLFTFVESWLRDIAAVAAGANDQLLNFDAQDELTRLVDQRAIDPVAAADSLVHVERAAELARGNVNPQLLVNGLITDLRRRLLPTPTSTRTAAASAGAPP